MRTRWPSLVLGILGILVPLGVALQGFTVHTLVSIEHRLTALETRDALRGPPRLGLAPMPPAILEQRAPALLLVIDDPLDDRGEERREVIAGEKHAPHRQAELGDRALTLRSLHGPPVVPHHEGSVQDGNYILDSHGN